MGIYRHFTDAELQATRTRLMASLQDRLTGPMLAAQWRSVQYQQNVAEIRKEIAAVSEELDRRSGAGSRGPIYIV
jgi:hypothetical protein